MIARRIVPAGWGWTGLLRARRPVVVVVPSVGIGSADSYVCAPPRKTAYARMATDTTVQNPAQPALPNLRDAATCERFERSFARGSFRKSLDASLYHLEGGIDCSSDASRPHDDIPDFGPGSSGLGTRRGRVGRPRDRLPPARRSRSFLQSRDRIDQRTDSRREAIPRRPRTRMTAMPEGCWG